MTPKQEKRLRLKRRHHNQSNKGQRGIMQLAIARPAITQGKLRMTIPWR